MKSVSPKTKRAAEKAPKNGSRKLPAASPRESESPYRLLFETTRDGILLANGTTGEIVDVNPGLLDMLGYDRGEIVGKKVWEICADPASARRGFQKRRDLETAKAERLELKRRDGRLAQAERVSNFYKVGKKKFIQENYRDISEQLRAEETLRAGEKRLAALIEYSRDNISLLDAEGRLLWESPSANLMLGYEPGEYTGRNIFELIHPDDLERAGRLFDQTARKKKDVENEILRLRSRDGSWRWVEVTAINRLDDPGIGAIIANHRDITEKVAAEETLKASERRFRSLIENSFEAVAMLDAAGRVIYESPSGPRLTGYSAEERVGGTGFNLLHPDDLGNVRRIFSELIQTPGAVVHLQTRSRHKNGEWLWLDVTGINALEDPAVGGVVVNYRDITESKRAEEALKRSEEKFFKAFHAAPDAVLITRMENAQIAEVNDGFCRIMEYSKDEAIGRTTLELGLWFDAADRDLFLSLIQKDGHIRDREFKYRAKSGRVIDALLSAEVIFIGGERHIMGIIRDVTESKQAEEALAEAERTQKLLLESAGEGIHGLDAEGRIMFENDASLQMFGWEAREMFGQNAHALAHHHRPDGSVYPVEECPIHRTLRDGETRRVENEAFFRKDGTSFPVEYACAAMMGGDGAITGAVISFRDITERRQAEEALRTSENRFRAFTEATDEGVVFHDAGLIVDVNPALVSIFSYGDASELVGKPLLDFVAPESRELVLKQVLSGSQLPYEAFGLRKDGSVFPVESSARTYQYQGRRLRVASIRDITERRQAEKSLRDLSHAVNASGDAVFMTDGEGVIASVNPQFTGLYGYSPEEVVGKMTPRILKSGKQPPEVYERFWATIKRGELFRGELVNKTKDGRLIPIEETVSPFFDERGEIAGFLAIQRNIADRRQAEEALQESEERYRLLAETSQDSITVINRDYAIEYTNTFAAHQIGIPAQTLVGKRLTDIFPPDIASRQQANLQQVFDDGQSLYIEAPAKFQGVMSWLSTWLAPIRDEREQIRAILVVSRDITERKQAEESLRMAEARYRALVENIPAIVYMDTADETSANLYVSPYTEKMLGYPASTYIENPTLWHDQVDPRDYPRAVESIRKTLTEGFAVEEYRLTASDGKTVWVRDLAVLLRAEDGEPQFIQGFIEDISAQKQAEEKIAQNLRELAALHGIGQSLSADITLERVVRSAVDGTLNAAQADAVMFFLKTERGLEIQGYGPSDSKLQHDSTPILRAGECLCGLAAQEGKPVYSFNIHTDIRCTLSKCKQAGVRSFASLPLISEGEIIGALGIASTEERNFEEQALFLESIAASASISLRNALLYEKVKSHAEELEKEIAERKRAEAALIKSERDYRYLFNNAGDAVLIFEPQNEIILQVNATACRLYGLDYEEIVGKSLKNLTKYVGRGRTYLEAFLKGEASNIFESTHINKDGAEIEVLISIARIEYEEKTALLALVRDVTERRQAQEALRRSEARLMEAQRIAHLGNWEWDVVKNSVWWSDELYRIFDLGPQEFDGTVEGFLKTVHPDDRPGVEEAIGKTLNGEASYDVDHRIRLPDGTEKFLHEQAVMERDESGVPRRVIGISLDITERKRAEANIQKQLSHLRSLREIDIAITSGFDMQVNLNTLLRHTTSELGVDAAAILLFAPGLNSLEFAAGHGFLTRGIARSSLMMGEGHAGRAALERVLVHIADLNEDPSLFLRAPLLADEKFVCYLGVPLIAKGIVKGVLEVFHRAPLDPGQDWFDLLHTLAGQAAIAVENAQLFGNLQQSNMSLLQAYDSTIEGWSRALDLRDKETEGHTLRVTDTAIRLGQKLGLRDDELKYMRWGGLLHDIGKMGVPDAILLKAESLNPEEFEIMRQHPVFAYEMLAPIQYLKPALDIPYCHHEKWNGTGYPRGLKGEETPLAARIFAVADVYDALTSDRPYRSRWTKRQAIDYIRENSGEHFDPQVVNAFIEMFGGDDLDQ